MAPTLEDIQALRERRTGERSGETRLEAIKRLRAEREAARGRPVPRVTLSTGKRIGSDEPSISAPGMAPSPDKPTALSLNESVELAGRSLLPDFVNRGIDSFYDRGPAQTAKDVGRLAVEYGATTAAAGPAGAPIAAFGLPLVKQALKVGAAGAASSLLAEKWDPSEQPLKRAATTGLYTAVGEGLGSGLALGINKVLGLRVGLEPGAREAFEQLQGRATPSPGQLTTNPLIDVLENISESSLTKARPFQRRKEAAQAVAEMDVEGYARKFIGGRGREDVGASIQDAIAASGQMRRETGSQLYQWFDEVLAQDAVVAGVTGTALEGSYVSIMSAVNLARKRLEQSGGRNAKITKVVGWLEDMLEKNPDGRVSWHDAQMLRSDLLGVGRVGDELITGQAQAVAKLLAHEIDGSMSKSADNLAPDLKEVWRFANAFWKETAEKFGHRSIKAILKADPETVLRRVARADMPGTVRMSREAIVDPLLRGAEKLEAERVWKNVQGHVLLRMARDAQDTSRQTQGRKGMRILDKYGEDTLDELFLKGSQATEFRKLMRTLELTQSKAGEGLPGGMMIQLGQAGAIAAVASGHLDEKALAFVIAPHIFGKLLLKEGFVRWVAIGRKAPPGSKLAMRAYSRIQAFVAAETQNEVREQKLIDAQTKKENNQ